MTMQESIAEAKARRAAIIDRISMGESQEVVSQAAKLRAVLACVVIGLVIVGVSIRVRRNGV